MIRGPGRRPRRPAADGPASRTSSPRRRRRADPAGRAGRRRGGLAARCRAGAQGGPGPGGAGVVWHARPGDAVTEGEPLSRSDRRRRSGSTGHWRPSTVATASSRRGRRTSRAADHRPRRCSLSSRGLPLDVLRPGSGGGGARWVVEPLSTPSMRDDPTEHRPHRHDTGCPASAVHAPAARLRGAAGGRCDARPRGATRRGCAAWRRALPPAADVRWQAAARDGHDRRLDELAAAASRAGLSDRAAATSSSSRCVTCGGASSSRPRTCQSRGPRGSAPDARRRTWPSWSRLAPRRPTSTGRARCSPPR